MNELPSPMTREAMLDYFRDAVEGRPGTERWSDWWARHAEAARPWMTPGQHLRLRLGERVILETLLSEAGIVYSAYVGYSEVFHEPCVVPPEHLTRPSSVDEVEADLTGDLRRGRWAFLKSKMDAGDEVWRFSSTADSWANRTGRGGYALVRAGVPYDAICTVVS